jgi:GrpB-like predicted nucleotidyltransferase (UPF0157 family)/quercetin dioxygenase-like cupin family protein
MRIFRFDESVSIPIERFGSRFRIGPLTGWDSRARVQVMHLPADGLIGRHRAVGQQLVACVAGAGRVSGGDGGWRELQPGEAALWDDGEDHETRSDGGMTLVCIEGTFEVWATAVTGEIEVVDHDPAWAGSFERLRDRIWPAVADLALGLEHVGSTSVPGLAAKPVIDLDVVVADEAAVRAVIERLVGLGYQWRGDLGVVGRQAFRPVGPDDLPRHHLYLVVEGSKPHLDHVLLRDLLLADDAARDRYGELKRRNVELAGGDMDRYVALKHDLVTELLARARRDRRLPPA